MDRPTVERELSSLLTLKSSRVESPQLEISTEGMYLSGTGIGSGVPITRDGFASLLKYFGVPRRVINGLRTGSTANLLTELMEGKAFNVLHTDQRVVDIIAPSRAVNINMTSVLDSIESAVPEAEYNRVLMLPHFSVQLEVLGHREETVTEGDLVRGGVMVRFSPVGLVNPLIQPFMSRLICANGATSFEVIKEFPLGNEDSSKLPEWFTSSFRAAYESFDSVIDQWRALATHAINPSDRALILSGVVKKARLSSKVQDMIYAQAMEEPPRSAYDVLQLITWAASHTMEDPVKIIIAQHAAAGFATEIFHEKHCPTCNRVQ